jgi:hypothetical protein
MVSSAFSGILMGGRNTVSPNYCEGGGLKEIGFAPCLLPPINIWYNEMQVRLNRIGFDDIQK